MCGIAGFYKPDGLDREKATRTAEAMISTLRHRGPDDGGVWIDGSAGIALAHRRLSIIDLSAAGHQPMTSASGRYVLTYNGEIYNHLEIRGEVDRSTSPTAWRGHSDTETILEAVSTWGIERTLSRAVGMFAFALWDRSTRRLTIARDRVGEKPLYFGWAGPTFIFGSELKAFRANPDFEPEIDRDALALYFRHNYVPSPWSIYKGVSKLQPGCYLTVDAQSWRVDTARPITYWSAREMAGNALREPFGGDEREAGEELERLLRGSITGQMIADVPVAAFLSGGIDSSTIVALMQSQSTKPVKTFSIGSHDENFNEARHAAKVAAHLRTDHVELYVTPQQALSVVPLLPELYDEPFADSSQVPTYLMTSLTQQHVSVALSGDAGDELFGGYNRYFWAMEACRRIERVPRALRHLPAGVLRSLSPSSWDKIFTMFRHCVPRKFRYSSPGDKLHKLASILQADDPMEIYTELISHWSPPTNVVLNSKEKATAVTDHSAWLSEATFPQQMMFLDLVSYLPDDILVKVDRAAMGTSLETRIPMLDHRVIEFAWRLPMNMKIRAGQGKWLLRELLYRFVPRELVDRPKMGFGIPLDAWLRGPLKDWAESLLDEARMTSEGFLNPAVIQAKWNEHQSGSNWAYHLWDVLMFQAWHQKAMGADSSSHPRADAMSSVITEYANKAYA